MRGWANMLRLAGDSQSYQQIAAAGYTLSRDPSRPGVVAAFKGAFEHLAGRTFFAEAARRVSRSIVSLFWVSRLVPGPRKSRK